MPQVCFTITFVAQIFVFCIFVKRANTHITMTAIYLDLPGNIINSDKFVHFTPDPSGTSTWL